MLLLLISVCSLRIFALSLDRPTIRLIKSSCRFYVSNREELWTPPSHLVEESRSDNSALATFWVKSCQRVRVTFYREKRKALMLHHNHSTWQVCMIFLPIRWHAPEVHEKSCRHHGISCSSCKPLCHSSLRRWRRILSINGPGYVRVSALVIFYFLVLDANLNLKGIHLSWILCLVFYWIGKN